MNADKTTDILSIEVINQLYQDEFVILGDFETNESLEVLRGRVLLHGPDRNEVSVRRFVSRGVVRENFRIVCFPLPEHLRLDGLFGS